MRNFYLCTTADASEIKKILVDLRTGAKSPNYLTSMLRNKYGFYISNFFSGFDNHDFDAHVANGAITLF